MLHTAIQLGVAAGTVWALQRGVVLIFTAQHGSTRRRFHQDKHGYDDVTSKAARAEAERLFSQGLSRYVPNTEERLVAAEFAYREARLRLNKAATSWAPNNDAFIQAGEQHAIAKRKHVALRRLYWQENHPRLTKILRLKTPSIPE